MFEQKINIPCLIREPIADLFGGGKEGRCEV